jgi:signal transduction histidine kinase
VEIIEHHRLPRPGASPAPRLADRLEAWLHRPGIALAILIGSLLLTGAAWWAARLFALDDARQHFERRTDEVHARIEHRMASYEAVLRGGVAMLAAYPDFDRSAWRRYVDTVQPGRHYPGIQGFGIARLLAQAELAEHERSVRAEGFAAYGVRPAGPRELYAPIVQLEPLSGRNLRAFGYDMLSEPTRREAMLRARDSGLPAMSGIVTLVQEDGRNVQRGFLVYLPVYRDALGHLAGPGPQVEPARLWGWVYAPFRVQDLMNGILGADTGSIAFRLHDGAVGTRASHSAAAFYNSDMAQSEPSAARPDAMHQARSLVFGGRTWTIAYTGSDAESAADTWQSNLVAVCGVSIDLLLFWSIAALARRKAQFEREMRAQSDQSQGRLVTLTAVSGLSPDAVLVFERGDAGLHRLVFTNPAFSRWFGLRPEDLLGLSETAVDEWLDGLTHADEVMPALQQGDAHIVLAGPPRRVLERRRREDNRQRVYYFRDITYQTEVERLKNEFLTTAAHELRTPLASVYGFAELLLDARIEDAKRQRAVQIIHRQATVLKHLVNELLDLARIDSLRGRDFVAEEVDLRRIAELCTEALAQPDAPHRLRLESADTSDPPALVQVDPAKLQQALTNVIGNALKYSPPHAAVVIGLHRRQEQGRDWIGLRVSDQGIGMSEEEIEHAFDRFYRADPSGHVLGAGLGLSIVREIMEIHQGRVELQSASGVGTTVTLWVPAMPPAPADATPAPATARDAEPAEATLA